MDQSMLKPVSIMASKDGGNIVYVNEEKNLVISIAASFKPRIFII